MNILACQIDMTWEDRDANHRRVREALTQASPSPGDMLVLPEMFASGFSMDVAKIADNPDGHTQAYLSDLARQHRIHIVAGIVSRADDGRGRNEATVIAPDGREVARYHKIHPFSYGRETENYTGGNRIVTFDWNGFTVAPFICYDLRFPEIFRDAVRRGANMFLVIANWPTPRVHHWTTLLTARAIENQAYVVGVNRCGRDPNVEYPGTSVILDPRGRVMSQASDQSQMITATPSLQEVNEFRTEFPALRDMKHH